MKIHSQTGTSTKAPTILADISGKYFTGYKGQTILSIYRQTYKSVCMDNKRKISQNAGVNSYRPTRLNRRRLVGAL